MKRIIHLPSFLFVMLALLSLSGCVTPSIQSEGLVIADSSYRLESGKTLNTDLTIIGGNATLYENSTVNGDVTVVGGNVTIDGNVKGSVAVIGGSVNLEENADITGDLVTLGGSVRRAANAKVEGQATSGQPFNIPLMRALPININFDPVTGSLMAFFQALALAALAIVVQLFAAPLMERTGSTALAQPVVSGGVGLLTAVVAPALLVILAVTIILIPLSLLGFLAIGLAVLFGWLCMGMILGRQLALWLKQPWSDPVSAGIGTLSLSLLSSMLNLIPCLGWVANALIWLVAVGATILTRFGTQNYPSAPAPRPSVPYIPQPPQTPHVPAQEPEAGSAEPGAEDQ